MSTAKVIILLALCVSAATALPSSRRAERMKQLREQHDRTSAASATKTTQRQFTAAELNSMDKTELVSLILQVSHVGASE